MRIELHGLNFNSFVIPRYAQGVRVDETSETGQHGQYPVKAISSITILGGDSLYVGVDLRDDDEHLALPRGMEEIHAVSTQGAE